MNNQSLHNFSQMNSNSSFFADTPKNLQTPNFEMTNGTTASSSFSKQTPQKRQSFGVNTNFSKGNLSRGSKSSKRKVLSVSQILARVNQKKQRKLEQKKRKKPLKPIIPPKSFILLFKDKPEKYVYNRRIIDYKHCGLLQRYIGLGGKILPRRQTKLTAKQQRYVAKTIKSARIMGLLPFVTKERSFFR
jgi:small subunit ribosomal protein S18